MYPDHLSYIVGSGTIIDCLKSSTTCLTLPKLVNVDNCQQFVKELKTNWTHLVFPRYIDKTKTICSSGWVEIPLGATHFVFPKQRDNPCYLIGSNLIIY